ncbi:hypothetical protein SCHPADRAFT_903076 [Schizopora paradoxa]|uniref:TFG box profile domain-containing protein n=1 Tax=Schizopora paradoxa TaxID=27342 RepID=A0A0H2RYS7_9AGAM|nr:hypothetical protein SCHPADRAFT_903076 [Schizopora paradoxa]
MAQSFIGKSIALLSHSDVRYRGILAGLDPLNSTIQLQNVYSMGTETRRPPEEFIPPAEQPYEYIIFRASEVKDLALDNEPPIRPRSVHDDPAVLGAVRPPPKEQREQQEDHYQGAVPANLGARPPPQQVASVSPAVTTAAAASLPPSVPSSNGVPPVPEQPQAKRAALQQQGDAAAVAAAAAAQGRAVNRMASASVNSVHSATQSLENVERALGDLRLQNAQVSANGGNRGGRRSGGARERNNNTHAPITIPATEFDFESSNAKFKKTIVRKTSVNDADAEDSDSRTNPSDEEEDAVSKTSSSKVAKDDKSAGAYNPKASFFDSLSSSALPAEGGGRGGRGRGRGGRGNGRSRREEERERNFATFGEAGGVGLMGPDAYVGGYGGYGRGRRGGGGGGGRGGRGRGPRRGVPLSAGGDQ